jgi:pilus assembly protein CpaF
VPVPAPVTAPAPVAVPVASESPFSGEASAPSAYSNQPEVPAKIQESINLLLQAIGDDDSSEVIINGPSEVLQKIAGQRFHIPSIDFGDAETYHWAINNFVLPHCDTQDRIDGDNVLVEGQMELPSTSKEVPPMLARVHILCPPLVPTAKITIAKKARYEFSLDGIAKKGSMTPAMAELLKAIAHGRLTMVVSGPTGSGKTTLLQAMTREFDQNDRIIVIEDTPELRLPLADVVYLCSTTMKPGIKAEDVVSTEWLVKAANRMRMDRIIVGECRGPEMAEWLIAANSGADGSATTVHADNPRRALDKILGLATKAATSGSESTLRREIAATVDIVIQAGLIDGRHVITHIEEVSNTVRQEAGIISTQPLFEYNRATQRHEVKGRPSEDLQNTLRARGVTLNPAIFRGL